MFSEIKDILDRGIATDLLNAEKATFIFWQLAINANAINSSVDYKKEFLAYIQELTFNESIMALARIYDKPDRRYPTRCIIRLINKLKELYAEAPAITHKEMLAEQAKQYDLPDYLIQDILNNNSKCFAKHFACHMENEYQTPTFQSNIKELKTIRDKSVSHNEMHDEVLSITLPVQHSLIEFAKKFICMVDLAFFNTLHVVNGQFILTDIAKHTGANLPQILSDMGIFIHN